MHEQSKNLEQDAGKMITKWTRLSKKMSWILRHGANKEGLSMNEAGWVHQLELRNHLGITKEEFDYVVEHNNKSRFEWTDTLVRASQGHSLVGMPVRLDALEASWTLYEGDDSIWHGTNRRAIIFIEKEGIHPGDRTHVHLASSIHSHVGKRDSVSILVEVSCQKLRNEGISVFASSNGVLLARCVPVSCIVGTRMASKRKQRQLRTQHRKRE